MRLYSKILAQKTNEKMLRSGRQPAGTELAGQAWDWILGPSTYGKARQVQLLLSLSPWEAESEDHRESWSTFNRNLSEWTRQTLELELTD